SYIPWKTIQPRKADLGYLHQWQEWALLISALLRLFLQICGILQHNTQQTETYRNRLLTFCGFIAIMKMYSITDRRIQFWVLTLSG
ncbi:MAG: hypothetical protein PHS03_10605, partial [Sphaerochaeta sp.]|nr:hypothetical protein [Sphaerochaeta sp.]